jgi:hypothetical protein
MQRYLADETEDDLIRADQKMHAKFGPDENEWTPAQVRDYLLALDAARIDGLAAA